MLAQSFPLEPKCDGCLSAGQGVADPRDDAIPLTFLGGRVVDQHAIDEAPGKVAAVVPDFSLAEARHDKEPWCHPLVYDIRWRIFSRQKHSRRKPSVVRN